MRLAWGHVFLGVLLIAPSALAGTPQDPELSDPAGDQRPVPLGSPAPPSSADLVQAWFWGETNRTLNLTLEVATLDSDTIAQYDVGWLATNPTGRGAHWGVRIAMATDRPRWTVTRHNGEGPLEGFADEATVEGSVTPGTPGNISWTLPRFLRGDSLNAKLRPLTGDGMNFTRFRAASDVFAGPVSGVAGDEASSMQTHYWIGRSVYRPAERFTPPTREPDVPRETTPVDGPADVQAAWADFGNESIDFVAEVGQLTGAAFRSCPEGVYYKAGLQVEETQYEPYVIASGALREVDGAIWTLADPSHSEGWGINGNVSVSEGQPGFVRLQADRDDWTGEPEVSSHYFRFESWCLPSTFGGVSNYREDFLPAPGLVAAAIATGLALRAARARRGA